MSSWTDKAPTFNPYVQQVPVETMAAVGMQKQQQYDTNVQRITEQIDKIAGLDIVRDIDKTYLQSKLNELGNNLRTFAASDFSNYQLTNSTVGMVNNVAKDKYVINAVNSTAKYRKALERREKIINDGKGSASREWLFNMESNEWLNNNDLNAKYNGDYKPYKDYSKSAQEIVKGLAKDYTENDVYLDSEGNVIDVMTKQKIEGITPEKIQTALKAGLNPDDWEQLQVDGRYKYSNVDEATFLGNIEERYNKSISSNQERLDDMIRLKNAAASPQEKQRLQGIIDGITENIKNTENDFNEIKSSIEGGNLESAKATLFTNQWMNNFSNAFSSKSVSQTVHDNPAAKMKLEKEKFRHAQVVDWANIGLREQEVALKTREQDRKDKESEADANNPNDPNNFYGNMTLGSKKEDHMKSDLQILDENRQTVLDINDSYNNKVNTIISAFYDKDNPESVAKMKKDYLVYKNNPLAFDPLKEGRFFQELQQLEIKKIAKDFEVAKATQNAETLYPMDYQSMGIFNITDGKTGSSLATQKFTLNYKGETIEYNYLDAFEKLQEIQRVAESDGRKVAQERLDKLPKEYAALKSLMSGSLYNPANNTSEVYNNLKKLNNSFSEKVKEVKKQRDAFVANEFRNAEVVDMRQNFPLPFATPEEKTELLASVVSPLRVLQKETGIPGYDGNQADILANAKKAESFTILTDGKNNHSLVMNSEEGQIDMVPIPTEKYNELFKGRFQLSPGISYFKENILGQLMSTTRMIEVKEKTVTPMSEEQKKELIEQGYKEQEDGTLYKKEVERPEPSHYTTSLDGSLTTTADNAWLRGKFHFPNVDLYKVMGNVLTFTDPTSKDPVLIDLLIEDLSTGTVIPVTVPGNVSKDKIHVALKGIDDLQIFRLLNNGKDPSQEDIERLRAASKTIKN